MMAINTGEWLTGGVEFIPPPQFDFPEQAAGRNNSALPSRIFDHG
jgi:hypothetical protein